MVKILSKDEIIKKLKEILEGGEDGSELSSSIESLISELENDKRNAEYSEWNQD